ALYRSWALGAGQVLVAAGEIPRLRQKLLSAERSRATAAVQAAQVTLPAPTSVAIDNGELRENAQASLVQAVSELLKVKKEDIDANVELSEYGFDSISLTEFANVLNRTYQLELMPTIFFVHSTLAGLTDYLVKEHSGVV